MSDEKLVFNQAPKSNLNMLDQASAKAEAEVQAAFVIAKKFPRDMNKSFENILHSCERKSLAEQAIYSYKRGTSIVEGASIRLAEACALAWGNIDCGVKVLNQSTNLSVCEAYAIDLETNTRVAKIFNVRHARETKRGTQILTDARDVYEIVANMSARRLRACILAVIPGDVIEAAVEKVKKTLLTDIQGKKIPINQQIQKITEALAKYGITKEHIEKRLGHNLDASLPQELVQLSTIYRSIRDGVGDKSDFFDIESGKHRDKSTLEQTREKLTASSTKINNTKQESQI